MCGIFAYINYISDKKLRDILIQVLKGLRKLEYRGYDSCGICFDEIIDGEHKEIVAKTPGRVDKLEAVLAHYLTDETIFPSSCTIGHTRWATHGPPICRNAHPHVSSSNCEFVVVHNGIISNYVELKNRLLQESSFSVDTSMDINEITHQTENAKSIFYSDTDTEILAKLALFVYTQLLDQQGTKPTFLSVIANTIKLVQGTFGCVFKSRLYPDELVACRLGSPLLIGLKYEGDLEFEHAARQIDVTGNQAFVSVEGDVKHAPKPCELFIASDGTAFAESTKKTIILEDWDLVHITPTGVDIINAGPSQSFKPSRVVETLEISLQDIAKGEYSHFMLKEIMEQPNIVALTMRGRIIPETNSIQFGGILPHLDTILQSKSIMMIGCGTSYHAALAVRPLFEQYTRHRIFVEVASDFNDRKPVVFRNDVVIFLSQSGETADTLIALDYCKKAGAFCIGINNTPGSSLSRGTHCGVHLNCGAEIGVASTKAYTCSVVVLLMFLLLLVQDSVKLNEVRKEAINDLLRLPEYITKSLSLSKYIQEIAPVVAAQKSLIVLGRRTHYATARETALKVKELTYIHSEGLMTGELKHGPLALIDEEAFVVFFATGEDTEMFLACQSSLQQIKARGAKILVVVNEDDVDKVRDVSDYLVVVPKTSQWVQMIVNIIPMQLLSYFAAVKRGINVDRPRNLAKSVTVV